jgi:hypothetical protein
VNWIFWAPLAAAGLHIAEEFIYPGGFAAWYRRYKSGTARSITTRFLVIINVLLLVACYDIAALGPQPFGVAAWLTMMALLAANGMWHLRRRSRRCVRSLEWLCLFRLPRCPPAA